MSARNGFRVLGILLLITAGLTIRKHGWENYDWPVRVCVALSFLIYDPPSEGKTSWARFRDPKQGFALVLVAAAGIFLILSFR